MTKDGLEKETFMDRWERDPVFRIFDFEDSEHYREVLKSAPRITVDDEKCDDAYHCAKCLKACPNGVLATLGHPGFTNVHCEYRVVRAAYPEVCNLCNACVRACPEGAIKIILPGQRSDGDR